MQDDSHFLSLRYVDDNLQRLDARSLAVVHLPGEDQTIGDARHKRELDTAVNMWKNC